MKVGILIPHLFAQDALKDKVIFAPLTLAEKLTNSLVDRGHEVTVFTPGRLTTKAQNVNVDLSLIEEEIRLAECTLPQFIVQNPVAFITMSRQVHTELTVKALQFLKEGKIDLLHVYMCEDENPLYFSQLIDKPVIFTHHDPFNYYRKYRVRFPQLKSLNYVSISYAQRKTAPEGLNFCENIYNGVDEQEYAFSEKTDDYFASLGRIVQNKGVHIAIDCCEKLGYKLKIAGKHYSNSDDKDGGYWEKYIEPHIDNKLIKYEGFLKPPYETNKFLKKTKALLFPIEWDEPFGLVMVESLMSGTPVIAFDNGSVREIIEHEKNGFIVKTKEEMIKAMQKINSIDRKYCRQSVIPRFTIKTMVEKYEKLYKQMVNYT
ncbi:MAG TPA: glycosyltransferase [Candidatus Dojkabacteria bacterium]|nr:glycosyltransferase [Candidatus Dojkabacteria bacterium]HQF36074.1 glycosyltransferase [Candidatus Dojkabacteria bacterium]